MDVKTYLLADYASIDASNKMNDRCFQQYFCIILSLHTPFNVLGA